ncbi:ABC transporter ATP-binding protein [Micromonospora sp. NPDC005367]|uniref:ABC transporter ATP-binding protein n=1 Tax=Micromonospora sp. NPDC005367 TaxID=3155590 RepID=UPI0033BD632A
MSAILELRGLTVRFGGVSALDDVSLRHDSGGVVGLIGANGAGKTTLLNVLSGVVSPTRGGVLLDGRELTGRPAYRIARAGVARTYQNLQVFHSLSVLDNVLVPRLASQRWIGPAAMLGLPMARREERRHREYAADLLAEVGLAGRETQPAGSLPYGLQRRLEIARALAGGPRLLLLDEPLAGLARGEGADLVELVSSLAGRGITVLLVEHDVASVLQVSDRLVVLDHGTLLADGDPSTVVDDPAVRAAYLGEEVEHRD